MYYQRGDLAVQPYGSHKIKRPKKRRNDKTFDFDIIVCSKVEPLAAMIVLEEF